MNNVRAKRNRTITLSRVEEDHYGRELTHVTKSARIDVLGNCILNQDVLEAAALLPNAFVDLLMPENTDHPTQKPEKLLAKLILASTNQGDFVLDPFMGAGSSIVTAKKLNRRFLGIEIERQYCLLAAKRLHLAELDPAIQGYTDGVFWERNTLAVQRRKARRSKHG